MKQIYIFLILLGMLTGCSPVEDRAYIGGAITAEELDISATPIVVDGMNSNKVVLKNRSDVLSYWNYGSGISYKTVDTVLMIITGPLEIEFTGLNPNGTTIDKTLNVNVETLAYAVPEEYTFFLGSGDKTWAFPQTGNVWGNGGYLASYEPAWWTLDINALNEWAEENDSQGEVIGASMTFSLTGAKYTKTLSDGSTQTGRFSLDLESKKYTSSGALWAIGKLTLSGVNALVGVSPDEDKRIVYEYDVLSISEDQMILAYAPDGSTEWGTAYFWVFTAQ